ncbi:MAG: GNAT family N-acetyltransferase [Bryobacteraceae bacterium]
MLRIRPAERTDVPLILSLIRELAEYERSPHAVRATEEDLLRDGFGPERRFHCAIAEWNGEAAGFALYFYNYSTWEGRPGIYLEDLYVRPSFRKRGIGRFFFTYLAQIALAENLSRIQWQVLDWNQSAIDFYESLGAKKPADWQTMRLSEEAIERLAAAKHSAPM